jgi:hypothetical protein
MNNSLRRLLCEKVIAYRPILKELEIAKTTNGCLLASQLLYYMESRDGWDGFQVTDQRLREDTGMSIDEVRGARKDLESCGFFFTEKKGLPRKLFYHCDLARLELRFSSTESADSPVLASSVDSPEQKSPVVPTVRATARTVAGHSPNSTGPEPELSISRESKKENIKPPIVPQSEEKSKPVVKVPQVLIPIKSILADFIKNHKAGERSEQSCKFLFGQLLRILEDDSVNGDIDAIRQILDSAIESSIKGKPWQSIKYDNWIMYNRSKWIQYKNQRDLSNVKESQRTTLQIPDYHNRS